MVTWQNAWGLRLIEVVTLCEGDQPLVAVVDREGRFLVQFLDEEFGHLSECPFYQSGVGFELSVVRYLDYLGIPVPASVTAKIRPNPLGPALQRAIVDKIVQKLFDRKRK